MVDILPKALVVEETLEHSARSSSVGSLAWGNLATLGRGLQHTKKAQFLR